MPDQTFNHTYQTPGSFQPVYTDSTGQTHNGNPVTVTDPTGQLPPPANPSADPGSTTATLSWTAVTGADSYTVQWRPVGGTFTDVPVTASPYNLTGLTAGTDYEFQVIAKDSTGARPDSNPSALVAFTTTGAGNQLPTPAAPTTGAITDTSVVVNWTAVAGADRYVVEYQQDGTTEWVPRPAVTVLTDTVDGLTAGTTYLFRVIAQDSTGAASDSQPSPTVSAQTTGGSGPAITPDKTEVDSSGDATARTITVDGVGFTASTPGTVTLMTGAPGSGGTAVGTPANFTADAQGAFTAAAVVVPEAQATGDYHLVATDGTLTSDDTAITVTAAAALPQVTGLAAGTVTTTTVDLSWTATDPVPTAYHVQYRTPAGTGTWTDYATDPTTTTLTVDGLTAATEYEFQVKAVGDGSTTTDGPYSTPVTASTNAAAFTTESASTTTTRKRKSSLRDSVEPSVSVSARSALPTGRMLPAVAGGLSVSSS